MSTFSRFAPIASDMSSISETQPANSTPIQDAVTSPSKRSPARGEYLTTAERVWSLVNDPYTEGVSPRCVRCRGCHQLQVLDRRQSFYSAFWIKHKIRCGALHVRFKVDKTHPSVVGMPKPPVEVATKLKARRVGDAEKIFLASLLKDKLLPKKNWQKQVHHKTVRCTPEPLRVRASIDLGSGEWDNLYDFVHSEASSSSSSASATSSPSVTTQGLRMVHSTPPSQNHYHVGIPSSANDHCLKPSPPGQVLRARTPLLAPATPKRPSRMGVYDGDRNNRLVVFADFCSSSSRLNLN
ncbi:hypothetical protein K435DRAFT_966195 [Dendrothele bispora CBS 962.96]|uniref:Uncharacterized protein n=1 Tax=Dendrothele bispora (strain CBS 962.96) TaxID=1314807 RepID=A0A4S8M209_DENBC|nr:hypothetical protein K435DRAFT_966195 [Dendrothele bispora CBS 962.96]